jgi:F-type H+-transporting ATPase subunit a
MASSGTYVLISLAGFRVTSTLLATFLVDGVILLLVFGVRKRLSLVPGKLQGAVEAVVEYLHTTTEQVAGARAGKIFPWVAVFFLYIAISNLVCLIPGFTTVGLLKEGGFVPFLVVSTSDLNLTLALGIVSVVATNALAIRVVGFRTYLKRFFALNPLLLFVGLLELLQEVTKFITFSFRLFGNISAGEMVLGTLPKLSSLVAFVVPVPFLALEILVAVIQGMIFALLTMAFMTILTEPHEKEGEH